MFAPNSPLAATEAAFTTPVLGGYTLLQLGLAGLAVGGVLYFGVKAFRSAYQTALGSVV